MDVLGKARGFAALSILSLFAAACGPISLGGDGSFTPPPPKETVFAVDGVKLISSDIARGDDTRTFSQRSFRIQQNQRLLVRYEGLLAASSQVREDYPLRLRLFAATDADAAIAKTELLVCPLEKTWMMLASWTAAHPYAGGGWTPGGDFDDTACVAVEDQAALAEKIAADKKAKEVAAKEAAKNGTTVPKDTKKEGKEVVTAAISAACTEPRAVCFDVSKWYQTWVRERGENLGLILIVKPGSPQSVAVVGDGSPGKAPRIHWFETQKSW